MKILIVKLSAIGDVIHTLPALNAIRKQFPEAHITWLIEEAAHPLICGHPALDRILVSQRKRWIREMKGEFRKQTLKSILHFLDELRDTQYDLIFDFQALLKSAGLIALCNGRRKIGFDRGMAHDECSYIVLNEKIPPVSMEHHAILRNLMMIESVGIHAETIEYRIPLRNVDRKKVERLFAESDKHSGKRWIAINPVAKWDTKLWDNSKLAKLADQLTERFDVRIFFTGAKEDKPVIDHIQSMMAHDSQNFAGKTSLLELGALFEKAQLVISTDTGPMHLAAAIGTPVLAIFGPTAPWRTGPFGAGHQVVRAGLPCSPCFKRECKTMDCMEHIGVTDVLSKAEAMLV